MFDRLNSIFRFRNIYQPIRDSFVMIEWKTGRRTSRIMFRVCGSISHVKKVSENFERSHIFYTVRPIGIKNFQAHGRNGKKKLWFGKNLTSEKSGCFQVRKLKGKIPFRLADLTFFHHFWCFDKNVNIKRKLEEPRAVIFNPSSAHRL